MRNYRDLEAYCESRFLQGGPYWHIYTPGVETPVLFGVKEDYVFMMNLICQSAVATDGMEILAFEIMSNHLHIVVSGEESFARRFFAFLGKRLKRCAKSLTCKEIPSSFEARYKEIDSLQSLRNTIVYVNCNGFVTDSNYTPFTYPWGTGKYYFNGAGFGGVNTNLNVNEMRRMFRGRATILPDKYQVNDGEYLTDTELVSQLVKLLKIDYNVNSLRDLGKSQKYDLARRLRFEFRSSNEQIRRVLNLTSAEVNTIFPMTAKK